MSRSPFRPASRIVKKSTTSKPHYKDAALAELIDGVAHELNNSMAIALGHVQLLKLKNKDESVKEGLNRIEKSLFKCGGIIRAIQEYTGQPNAEVESAVSLSEVLTDALEFDETNWKETAATKNLTIFSFIPTADCSVNADQDDLVIAISHLIHNAVDTSPKNGSIEININVQDELANLTIADKGKGIKEELRKRIFEPFFSTKKTKGSGLGLTIVQSIVSRFGGRMGFASNAPNGTIFTISFPLVEPVVTENSSTISLKKETEKRILIVDDDAEVRNVLNDMLLIEGHRAENCADAYGALEMLEKGSFTMMITDLGLPGMSGYDLAEHVRDKYKDIEIVLLTGWGNNIKKDGRKLEGVKAVIPKPFRLNQVLDLVRS